MSENNTAKIARLVADPHADARAEVQGLLVEHERLTLELIATRARVAKLEEVIQTQNGVVVSGTLKLNEARARVAKLEAVLKEMHEHER